MSISQDLQGEEPCIGEGVDISIPCPRIFVYNSECQKQSTDQVKGECREVFYDKCHPKLLLHPQMISCRDNTIVHSHKIIKSATGYLLFFGLKRERKRPRFKVQLC